jgi:integrase/recombinase XerD
MEKSSPCDEVGLRDRALLGTLAYTFVRIGAVVNLKVEDYFQTGKRSMIRFTEKGGKETEIPVHTNWRSFLTSNWRHRVLEISQTQHSFRLRWVRRESSGTARRPELMQPEMLKRRAQRRRIVGCILSPFF